MSDVQDYHLQSWLKRKIATLPYEQRISLKNLSMCSHKILPKSVAPTAPQAVYLLSNGESAKFFGHITCKNTWCCPICTARVMEKRRQRVQAALDALGDKLFAFGMTFTTPHLRFQSCHEVTQILYDTWTRFNNCKSLSKSKEDNFTKPVKNFFKHLNIKYYVKIAEYTWGANGWHPHFHCIFWTDYQNKNQILSFQKQLQQSWNRFYENCAKSYWKKNNLDRDINKFLNIIDHAALSGSSESVNFSKNTDGSIMQIKSSEYVAGWGGDSEITGNYQKKASHEQHFTPYQILEKAEHDKKFEDLYIEFCLEVSNYVHKRTAFARGLTDIINKFIEIQGYKNVIKKKSEKDWKILCWFTYEQWQHLCYKNKQYPILSNILFLAQNSNNLDILFDYLISEIGEVFLPANSNPIFQFIENFYNKKAA